jgi:SAM-dependent methyltransferase
MKGYDEIKRILVDEFGFSDLAAYRKWISEARSTVLITPERIQALSPDLVDCRAFWRACEELFGFDPVANVAISPTVGKLPYAVENAMDANRLNLRLAKSLGITAFLDEFADERVRTLEIGAGFGSLKNYIETNTRHVYTGVDVFPRVPGVVETTASGFIPDAVMNEGRDRFSYVVSSNVFQHLSARQRARYFDDAFALLHTGGIFLFNLSMDTGQTVTTVRDAAGVAWCDHYGQYTLIPKPQDLQRELTKRFFVLYATQRYDGVFNFVCQKRQG